MSGHHHSLGPPVGGPPPGTGGGRAGAGTQGDDALTFQSPAADVPPGDAGACLPDAASADAVLAETALAETGFVKLEKNLASLGFFTPASKNTKKPVAKTIQFTRLAGGSRVTSSVSIAPSVLSTLPTTADQDKYFAFQKLLMDRRQAGQPVSNPVAFGTADLLRVLGDRADAGKNHQDVARWLQVMTATTIVSEGAVYLASGRAWATDTFHVFDRAVSAGREMPDGTVADRNYVWLSEWQLHNLQHNFLLPIDFEAYKALRNHIAKALVPLLQIWLFASEGSGVFEKRYDELCQHLHISRYRYLSKIREKLGPALDELVEHGYLSGWDVVRIAGPDAYKVVLAHGAKYFQDKARRADDRRPQTPAVGPPGGAVRAVEGAPPPSGRGEGAGRALKAPHGPRNEPRVADGASRPPAALPGALEGHPGREAETAPPGATARLGGLWAVDVPQTAAGTTDTAGPGDAFGPVVVPDRVAADGPDAGPGAGPGLTAPEAVAEEVCRHFHQVLYGAGAGARLLPAELREAAEVVRRHGRERALHLADYFVREVAPRTRFRPDTICGLRPHVARAAADYDARKGGGPAPAAAPTPLPRLRERHARAFRAAYEGYRQETFARLQAERPDVCRELAERDAAAREQEGLGLPVAIRAVTLRRFDREGCRLDRAWHSLAAHKDWGILTFWEWDVEHNPARFVPPGAGPGPADAPST